MVLRLVFFLLVFGFGGFLIFRWAVRAWRSSEVDERLDDVRLEAKLYDKIKYEDPDRINEKREAIDTFIDETDESHQEEKP